MNHDPTKRFSNRVENYIHYRPKYPKEIIPFLQKEINLTSSKIIADIGSGTGFLTELFLDAGNIVYGVEPNKEMRIAGEHYLKQYSNFQSIEGQAEHTFLPENSIDIIIIGQAFHWFELKKTKEEFLRILKSPGNVIIIWNKRLKNDPFMKEYNHLVSIIDKDKQAKILEDIDSSTYEQFFIPFNYTKKIFHSNYQHFDFNALQGRLFSSSYTPTDPLKKEDLSAKLYIIFEKYQHNNVVVMKYDTEVIYGFIK